jgi:transcriptional regulator with XRE-family HTH domain
MTKKVNINGGVVVASFEQSDIAAKLATRISTLRQAMNLTFDALAERAEVSKGTLVQIEQGNSNPSIATLCRLAAALSVSVADLVSPAADRQTLITIMEANDARTLWTGPQGGSAVLLAGTKGPDMLEMWQWELKPGERFEAGRHGRGTREIIHVSSGKLFLEIEGLGAIVAAGATAMAQTDRPHAYANHGKSPVRFIMTVHEPVSAP